MRLDFDVCESLDDVSIPSVVVALVVLGLAILARFSLLDARGAHWDEGVHAYYAWEFLSTGEFTYEPWRHGPFLYYLSVPAMAILGEHVATGRAAVALVSLGVFPALYFLREELPTPALVFSALVLALHPFVLATARFYRNDVVLATFCLLLVGCYARYYRTGRWPWAVGAGAFAGLAFATKEVAFLVLPAIAGSILVVIHFAARFETGAIRGAFDRYLPARFLALAAVGFVPAVVFFFAGWPPDPTASPGKFAEGLTYWLSEGRAEEGRITYYLEWTVAGSPLLVGLATIGVVGTVLRPDSAWMRWIFLGWAGFVALILSLIGDQSWWNVVIFVPPIVLLAGYGLTDLGVWLATLGAGFRGRLGVPGAGRAASPLVPASTGRVLGAMVLALAVAVIVVTVSTAAVTTPGSAIGLDEPNLTTTFGLEGITVPAESETRDRDFQAARQAALDTGCPGIIGPGVHVWPARWWFRGIEHDRVTDLAERHLPAVVVTGRSYPELEERGYEDRGTDEHHVYVPSDPCSPSASNERRGPPSVRDPR